MSTPAFSQSTFNRNLKKYYTFYTVVFILFLLAIALAEQLGMSRPWIGYWFLFATIALYAGIGWMTRTQDVAEYYVAGRRVPSFFNGMATGADWMSAASFIGMAGTLFLSGYDGLAWVMGWTGGFCLVALFLAPYLRKFGQFTIPDFLAERYGGNIVRSIGVVSAITCSFVYVVAQIYGVGLIVSRMTGLEFGVGVFVGLAGILVCAMLGGMRAVTWTQVAQYIVLIIAYMTPVVWLGVKHTGIPVPQFAYGYTLQKLGDVEKKITADPKEIEVRKIFADRAAAGKAALASPDKAYADGKAKVEKNLADLKTANAPADKITEAERAVAAYPASVNAAKVQWTRETGLAARAAPLAPHAQAFPGKDEAAQNTARLNFIGIVFCMMFGTAALPHILMRYYTTPSVQQARVSVFWSLFFIFLLYFTAPCLAVLAKYDMYTHLVGSSFASLPAWASAWAKVDPSLLSIVDINGDGIVQLAEIVIGGDLIVLATPEIAGLPYVVSGLVAAGGLAAALSTADGLLLTIANALAPDCDYREARVSFQVLAGLRRDHGGLRDFAQARGHPVPGGGRVLAGGILVLPVFGDGHILEARQQVGGDRRHGRGAWDLRVLHGYALPVLRHQYAALVRLEPGVGGHVRPAGKHDHDLHRELADPRASEGGAGAGRARALPEPGGRYDGYRRQIASGR